MRCNAILITQANQWKYTSINIGGLDKDEVMVEVHWSSLCHTDRQVIDGSLEYYKNGTARYPIVPGHEWCGVYDGQPVTGICILGCGVCENCIVFNFNHCSQRREVGVLNHNGAHAEYLAIPSYSLISVPKLESKYCLVEPIAVVLHALCRVEIRYFGNILISGYGNIGRICCDVLRNWEVEFDIYDPKYNESTPEYKDYDLLIECSGNIKSLKPYLSVRGGTILALGFKYDSLAPGILVSNELKFVGSLGATKEDFLEAVDMVPFISGLHLKNFMLSEFGKALNKNSSTKACFERNQK